MSMPKGARIERGYATVVDDEGENYRTIAETMNKLGHKMNHASARNWVLRVMKKFAVGFAEASQEVHTEEELDAIAKSPNFQSAISEIVQRISAEDSR